MKMNKERRNRITSIINKLGDIKNVLQQVLDDEVNAFENMPEGLQCSMRGEASEEAQGYMETAIENLENAIEELSYID